MSLGKKGYDYIMDKEVSELLKDFGQDDVDDMKAMMGMLNTEVTILQNSPYLSLYEKVEAITKYKQVIEELRKAINDKQVQK